MSETIDMYPIARELNERIQRMAHHAHDVACASISPICNSHITERFEDTASQLREDFEALEFTYRAWKKQHRAYLKANAQLRYKGDR